MASSHSAPDSFAARTQSAVLAATAVAADFGLPVTAPRVLHDAFSVVVQLAPSPAVARVPVVLPRGVDGSALAARQRRELAVVDWLAGRGVPVVPPSQLLPREPVQHAGFSMTFWEFVEVDTSVTPDYVGSAGVAADLHAALRDYPGELPFLSPVNAVVPAGLKFLAETPGLIAPSDLTRAELEWSRLQPILTSPEAFATRFPNTSVQPVHGDAPSYNLIHTTSGIRYADFEDVTLGPAEWDLAQFGAEAAAAYDARARRAQVRPLDPAVLRAMDSARILQVIACLALVPELPMLAAALEPSLAQWRSTPPFE